MLIIKEITLMQTHWQKLLITSSQQALLMGLGDDDDDPFNHNKSWYKYVLSKSGWIDWKNWGLKAQCSST
jgi:hypothetical protein